MPPFVVATGAPIALAIPAATIVVPFRDSASLFGSLSLLVNEPVTGWLTVIYAKSSPANGGSFCNPFISANTSICRFALETAPAVLDRT